MNHIGILLFTYTCSINGGEKFYVPRLCPGFKHINAATFVWVQVTFLYKFTTTFSTDPECLVCNDDYDDDDDDDDFDLER